jgi:hypothetical protein
MHSFEKGRCPKLFPLNGDLAPGRIESDASLGESVLPLDDERPAVSAAARRMRAIHAKVLQNLLRDFIAR